MTAAALHDDDDSEDEGMIGSAVAQIMASRYQPRVDDRVRVTGGIAECRREWGSDMPDGHPMRLIGWTGIVETPPTHLVDRSIRHAHPVAVRFSEPFEVEGVVWWGAFFTATELEPVAPRRTGERGDEVRG